MESRIIHKISHHLENRIEWIKYDEFEWIYCGSRGEVKYDVVNHELYPFFTSSKYFVVTTRNESFITELKDLQKSISDLIGQIDFFIWDANFCKVIEFNKIGVFRKGICAANIGIGQNELQTPKPN